MADDYTKIRPNQEEIDAALPRPLRGSKLSELPEVRQDAVKRQVFRQRAEAVEREERDKRRAEREKELEERRAAAQDDG